MRSIVGRWIVVGLVAIVSGAVARDANAVRKNAQNELVLDFHFQYLPSTNDLTLLREQVERARLQICDATDQAVKIGGVRLTMGQGAEPSGDVWLFSTSGGSHADFLGGRAYMFPEGGSFSTGFLYSSGTIAHELGHSLFGLGDSYRKDVHQNNFLCGFGPSIDPGGFTDTTNSIMLDSASVCRLPDGRALGDVNPNWGRRCSGIMGECGTCPACPAPFTGAALTCDASPLLASEITVASNFDQLKGDCDTPPCADMCVAHRPATNLFITAALDPSQAVRMLPSPNCGNGVVDPGEQCDTALPATSLPLCTDFGLLPSSFADRVNCAANCTFSKGSGFGPCLPDVPADFCTLTAGREDACVAGVPPTGVTCETYGMVSGVLGCFQCSVSLSGCAAATPSACGNGVVDAGEQCDLGAQNGTTAPVLDGAGVPLSCERFFGPDAGGSPLRCNSNCSFTKAACNARCGGTAGSTEACTPNGGQAVPPLSCADFGFGRGTATCPVCSLDLTQCGPGFDASSWDAARVSADAASGTILVVDGVGQVRRIQMFVLKLDAQTWQFNVLGLGEDYTGGVFGVPVMARTFLVTFNPANNTIATVKSGAGPAVAGTTGTMVLGGQPADGTGEGTPPFANVPAGQSLPLAITVDFSQVLNERWLQFFDNPSFPSGSTAFLAGTIMAAGAAPDVKQVSRCDDPTKCGMLWNSMTPGGGSFMGSWEGSQHRHDVAYHAVFESFRSRLRNPSEWEVLSNTVFERFGINAPAPDIVLAAAPSVADCGGPLEWDDFAVRNLAPDGVVMVLDRSGSMRVPVDAQGAGIPRPDPGAGETRMDFAKAASRDFLDLAVARGTAGPQVGLVTFSTTPTSDQAIARVVTSTTPAMGQVNLEVFKDLIDGQEASGKTGIGLALDQASDLFAGTTLMQKTIVLLSDGYNNEPNPIGEFDPEAVASRLYIEEGIRIIAIPTGSGADKEELASIVGITNGVLLDAPGGDELPAVYAEAFAIANGEALNLPRTPISVPAGDRCDTGEFQCPVGDTATETDFGCFCLAPGELLPIRSQTIPVEAGAEKLNVLLSARNVDVATWNPQFKLIDPNGSVVFTDTSSGIDVDEFYRILRVPTPLAGTWTLSIAALDLPDQHQFVQAHLEGAGPDCYARVAKTVILGSDPAVVTARPIHGGRPIAGAILTAELVRPDGSSIPLLPEPDGRNEYQLVIDPALYLGRGVHEVVVGCFVPNNATFASAEELPGTQTPVETSRPPAFTRFTRTSFFVDTTTQPPLPPGGDCDNNGIPDNQEPTTDTDGDGLPDVCDDDDDGDDSDDVSDPDDGNRDCSVPACPIANAGPDQIVQCSANDSATATLDGRGSSDADGQTLTFAWTSSVPLQNANQAVATGSFPLGTASATLTVSDGPNFASDLALVTVLDTTPPVLTPPPDIATPTCTGVNIGQPTAVDACGGSVTIVNDAPATFKAGTRVVTWRAIDRFGNVAVATQTIVIGLGNDRNCCPSGTTLKLGTSNNDTLTGTTGSDCIIGLGAQDTIRGLGGNDFLSGGEGDDVVEGGDGNDQVEGGSGQDVLRGGNGIDALVGNDGDDQCFAGPQDDRLHGGQGQDKLFGEDGNDRMFGENGDDRLEGAAGNDLLNGGGLHDTCIGGTGTNTFVACEVQQ